MSHYETLGVAETATPDEIKSAFRRMAKQHHPDLGGDAEKFQSINEAYETLSNADKRAHYDYTQKNPQPQFRQSPGFEFNFGGGNPDIFNDINSHFSEMFGFQFRHAQTPRNRNIRVQIDLNFLETLEPIQKTINYNISHGDETITLELPPGVQDNTILQISGRGDNSNQAVPRGNLEVVVKIKPHPKFTRVDDHVLTEVTVNCFEAILGLELDLETPRGKHIKLNIPPGTQSGTQFGITDEGFTRSNRTIGKFIVRVNVKVPTALTKEQLNLVQQIQQLRPVNT